MVGLKIKKEKILFAGVARPPKCLNDPNFSECLNLITVQLDEIF